MKVATIAIVAFFYAVGYLLYLEYTKKPAPSKINIVLVPSDPFVWLNSTHYPTGAGGGDAGVGSSHHRSR
jgi:hypothetical protein